MDIAHLRQLASGERELIFTTPALVTYLVGGADGRLEKNEEARAALLVHFRSSIGDPLLYDYFSVVEQRFSADLDRLVEQYSALEAGARRRALSAELGKLNQVLPGVDAIYARSLLKSWRSLAKSVAEASGGVLGFLEITYDEQHLSQLKMITVEP